MPSTSTMPQCRYQVGTIKYVWEPSRHHQLTVAGDSLLSSQAMTRYYRSFVSGTTAILVAETIPFFQGVHWTSGIELGVRLVSWVWVRRLLDGLVGRQGAVRRE